MERLTIVVIDDDSELLDTFCALLTLEQFACVPHRGQAGAMDLVRTTRPALVILDTWLEQRRTGQRLLAELRVDPETRDIPLLICTADEEYLTASDDSLPFPGVRVLRKPFDVAELLAAVTSLIDPVA